MNNKEMNTNISLNARAWIRKDEDGAGTAFIRAGFSNTEEIMELRIFDMLNIFGIDRIRAEEMMYALYRFFNENRKMDDALYRGIVDQYYDFAGWRNAHPDASKVIVRDIVMAVGMNIDALISLFDQTVRKFWKSGEYNSREYRYWGYKDLLEQRKEEEAR